MPSEPGPDRPQQRVRGDFDALLAKAPFAAVTWTPDERVAGWDAGAARLLGWSATEQLGRPAAELNLFDAQELARLAAALRALRDGTEQESTVRLPTHTRSGAVLECEWHNIRLPQEAGKPAAILSFVLDVSRLARAESELRRLQEQNETFIAALSHELRDPLAPLRNAAYLLRSVAPDAKQRAEIVELIERQIDQMARRLDQLVDASRSAPATAPLHDPVHLQLAVRDAVEQMVPRVEAAGQSLLRKVPAQPVRVRGDAAAIAQMIVALLDNAIKFTPPGGLIEVKLATASGNAVVTVKDSGQGLDAAHLRRIQQAVAQPPGHDAGAEGLGLATVKALVAAHRGSLGAFSEGPGRGASFSLSLPLLEEAPAAEPPRGQKAPRRPHLRIIVIDDNQDNADTLNTLLTMMGHQVRVGYDGTAALREAAAEPFDAMLLDVGLPDIDGYEVAQRLRARGVDKPLIAISGYGQPRDKERAMAAGFDKHLTKPVSIRDVAGVLDEVAQRLRASAGSGLSS